MIRLLRIFRLMHTDVKQKNSKTKRVPICFICMHVYVLSAPDQQAWKSVDTISGIINPRLFSVDKYVFIFFFRLKCYLS